MSSSPGLQEVRGLTEAGFAAIRAASRPAVIRGLAKDWPLVRASAEGPEAVASLLRQADSGAPLPLMEAPPAVAGRFFYDADLSGFNFRRGEAPMGALLDVLLQLIPNDRPPSIYAGAAALDRHAPALAATHRLPFAMGGRVARLWLGNRSRIALHVDMSDNVAVVAAGERRVRLFAPEATAGLYPGPLNITPAGQPVSMVDPDTPDLSIHPGYAGVAHLEQQAVLAPGDAIYIPTMWWHGFDAMAPFNLLLNFWDEAQHSGGALHALVHAMLEVRDLPPNDRAAWAHWFQHYVFGAAPDDLVRHLPPEVPAVQGRHGDAQRAGIIRWLESGLKGRG